MAETSKMSFHCPDCGANVSPDSVRCSYCNSVLTITSCPSCFGPVFKGAKFCPSCGTAIERNEVESDRSLTCPRCEHALSAVKIGSVRVHECTNCGGLWLNTSTFKKICEDKEQQENAMSYPLSPAETTVPKLFETLDRMYVPCPECGVLMTRDNFAGCSGVVVDLCRQHGTWFDRQELQQIINFIRSGGLGKARKSEMDKLQEEQRRIKEMEISQNLEHLRMLQNNTISKGNASSLIDIISSIGKLFT